MFENFTKPARGAIVLAQEEARDLCDEHIDIVHLLLGLAGSGSAAQEILAHSRVSSATLRSSWRTRHRHGLDSAALAELGIDFDAVRQQVESKFGEGALDQPARGWHGGHIPFSPGAKRALQLAMFEARNAESKEIGGSHMLLGAIGVDSIAAAELVGGESTLGQLRDAARAHLN